MKHDIDTVGRRGFLISGLRSLILGAIVLLSGILSMRFLRASDAESACTIALPCKSCTKLGECGDSKALSIKREQSNPKQVKNDG